MNETRIEPALWADAWKEYAPREARYQREEEWNALRRFVGLYVSGDADVATLTELRLAAIALANAALPSDDPRKITRHMVDMLDYAARLLRLQRGADCPDAANVDAARYALASYLPPE